MSRLVLVTGGSGSGKSVFAEQLVLAAGKQRTYYLATMKVTDDEAGKKAEKHVRRRASFGWETMERQRDLEEIRLPGPAEDTAVLLEDLPNLLAGEMFPEENRASDPAEKILRELESLRQQADLLVVVSGEVFADGLWYGEETQRYIRTLGILHQRIAQDAGDVAELVCGIPIWWKKKGETNGAETGR